jgi:hypothetical protein
MQARAVGLGEILEETKALFRTHAAVLVGTSLAIGVGYTALDFATLQTEEAGSLAFVSLLVSLAVTVFLQYFVTERLLVDRWGAGHEPRNRRYGSLFGALFFSGLGLAVGLVFLVLPGIYLAARWLTVVPHLIEGNLTATEALGQSWDASAPSVPAFVVAILLTTAAMLPGMGLSFLPEAELGGNIALGISALSNLMLGFSSVFGWAIAVGAYRRTVLLGDGLQQVFD